MVAKNKNYNALCIDDSRIRRADCAHCAIRKQMLFADIDVGAAGILLAPVTNIKYEQGDMIYYQGDASDALFSLRSGIVKLSVASHEGDLRIVRLLGPGAVIGLECLLKQLYLMVKVSIPSSSGSGGWSRYTDCIRGVSGRCAVPMR